MILAVTKEVIARAKLPTELIHRVARHASWLLLSLLSKLQDLSPTELRLLRIYQVSAFGGHSAPLDEPVLIELHLHVVGVGAGGSAPLALPCIGELASAK